MGAVAEVGALDWDGGAGAEAGVRGRLENQGRHR